MLAGRRAFGGDEVPDVLANVLARDAEWRALPAATPPAVRRLIARCLTKVLRERLHHIADVRLNLPRRHMRQRRLMTRPEPFAVAENGNPLR